MNLKCELNLCLIVLNKTRIFIRTTSSSTCHQRKFGPLETAQLPRYLTLIYLRTIEHYIVAKRNLFISRIRVCKVH